MVLKTIKNKYIACLGLGYKLILNLVRSAHPPKRRKAAYYKMAKKRAVITISCIISGKFKNVMGSS
jgi:hypothetical protein